MQKCCELHVKPTTYMLAFLNIAITLHYYDYIPCCYGNSKIQHDIPYIYIYVTWWAKTDTSHIFKNDRDRTGCCISNCWSCLSVNFKVISCSVAKIQPQMFDDYESSKFNVLTVLWYDIFFRILFVSRMSLVHSITELAVLPLVNGNSHRLDRVERDKEG